VKFDGRTIRPLLEGKANTTDGNWPDRILVTDSQRVKDPIKWRQSAVMTNQWRLNNGKELYDIKADPGQTQNVAAKHPEVMQRLTAFYDAWWQELEPTFAQDCSIYLGDAHDNPATLTCHDWITTGSTPWNHASVRSAMSGDANTGFWNVKVVEDGVYEIRIRRWPQESDTAIDAGLPPGADVPGVKAYRTTKGKAFKAIKATVEIGGQSAETAVEPGAKEVVFRLKLAAGVTRLSSRFHAANGNEIGGYYAYVKKL
jgi:arylsulfatase B